MHVGVMMMGVWFQMLLTMYRGVLELLNGAGGLFGV